MIIRVPRPSQQPTVILRRAGYVPFRDPNTGESSFTRRLGTHFYPRFHVYLEEGQADLKISIHLDQKQPSYGGNRKHNGEYDGPTVTAECDRIYPFFA